jgi:6-phosphogluconate dehydrogenase
MRFGIVGLGRMGAALSAHALEKKHSVAGFDRQGAPRDLVKTGLDAADSIEGLVAKLAPPRVVLLYVPHGAPTESVVQELAGRLSAGDIVVDGGNSHWKDSVRRHGLLKERGIGFLDAGTSGGIEGARSGACYMVGGEPEAFALVEPLLKDLAVPEGVALVGPAGAGHFAKLVHNAIEFGMLQAIGEGVDLLEHSDYRYDLPALFHNWAHGSVIRGWLVELMERGLRKRPRLEGLSSFVEDTREVRWAVEHALAREVWTPVIALSELALYRSRDRDGVSAKAVAVMRHEFGGHPLHLAGEEAVRAPRGPARRRRGRTAGRRPRGGRSRVR